MASLADVSATAKAWVGAAIAGLTGLSAFIVPESTAGVVITSAVGFLVALLAVFGKANGPERPTPPPSDGFLG